MAQIAAFFPGAIMGIFSYVYGYIFQMKVKAYSAILLAVRTPAWFWGGSSQGRIVCAKARFSFATGVGVCALWPDRAGRAQGCVTKYATSEAGAKT
jgi:hypothetical protein